MLAVAILWSLFTLFAVLQLIKPVNRRLREWEIKYKLASRMPTYPQLVIFLLLTLLMTTVSFAAAFHRDLRSTIGIRPGVACGLMIILPVLYFTLGWRKRKNG